MPEALPLGVRARQWAFFMSWRMRTGLVRLIVPRRRIEERGLRFTLPCENWITSYRWRTYASKEPETLDWIDSLRADDVWFDVGANIGVYTVYAAKRHPKMRIAAFEPEYANLHLLRDNVIENDVGRQVTIYAVALGRTSGVSYLHVQDLHPGAALHSVSNESIATTRAGRPVVGREGIVQMTLDAFCAEADLAPSCMKIDVDGYEFEVLEGARHTLASLAFRSLLIEMPEREADSALCRRLLEDAGLRPARRKTGGSSFNEVWSRA